MSLRKSDILKLCRSHHKGLPQRHGDLPLDNGRQERHGQLVSEGVPPCRRNSVSETGTPIPEYAGGRGGRGGCGGRGGRETERVGQDCVEVTT